MAAHPPRRVMLWAVPRSLSTVITKCISSVDGVQVINEPYVCSSTFRRVSARRSYDFLALRRRFGPDKNEEGIAGADKIIDLAADVKQQEDDVDAPLAFDESTCTYDWVKTTLEAEYPGKKLIFCKDMAPALEGKYQALPRGFKHTFIIRDPLKVFVSTKKMLFRLQGFPEEDFKSFRLTDLPPDLLGPKHMFGEMVDILHYLKEHELESNPVIIDADDLLSHPESILRQYCEAIGIPFSEDLLKWEAGDKITSTWITAKGVLKINKLEQGGFYGRALASTQFEASSTPAQSDLTSDVLEMAKAADKYYKELYELRLKP